MSDFKFDYETIEVRRDLAKALHVDLMLINKVLFKNSVDTYYKSFSIPKKMVVPGRLMHQQGI